MLIHLTVRDLALVDRVEIPFGPGLNVLTGETGAGKSVLVGALSIVLGGRAQSDTIREGAKEAVVEALFEVPSGSRLGARLEAQGIEAEDGQLVVRRTLVRGGRGRVHLNGHLATVGMLGRLLEGVVDLTGQHEHVALLDAERHLDFLDGFGGHAKLCGEMLEAHERVQALRTELARIDEAARVGAQRQDYLRYALDEIGAAEPEPGELEGLDVERRRLRAVHELMEGAASAEAVLRSEGGAVLDALGRIQARLERLADLDPQTGRLVSSAIEVFAGAEELAHDLERYRGGLEAHPARLEEVEDRYEALRRLCKKYGGSEAAVLRSRDAMAEELDAVVNHEGLRAARAAAVSEAEGARSAVADRLSEARREAAERLCVAIAEQLGALSMGGTRVEFDRAALAEPGARGAEGMQLLMSANPGEALRPLRKCASGGELSRVLLAIKSVLAHQGEAACHVFDEVDSGIGGAVAEVIGARLKAVANGAQVVAVTHLPQVAAYADRHVRVSKVVTKGRTRTRVDVLEEAACVEELARMVGGLEITDRTRGLAQELRARGRSADAGVGHKLAHAAQGEGRARGGRSGRGRRGTSRAAQ